MAKKKKQGMRLAVLLLVLVLLIVAYVIYSNYEAKNKKEDTDQTEKETVSVMTIAENDLKEIHYKNESGELKLVKDDKGSWVQKDKQDVPMNQDSMKRMAEQLEKLDASKVVVEDATDLSEYGLDQPVLTIEAVKADGTSTKILAGSKSAFGDGYYLCLNGEKKVYLVPTTFYEAFHYGVNDLVEQAAAPAIAAENVTHLLLEDKEQGNLEIAVEAENAYDYGCSSLTPYEILQGYKEPMAGDAEKVKTYLGGFSGLRYLKCVDYEEKDLEKYGLDRPNVTLSIDYFTQEAKEGDESKQERVDQSYHLLIGNLNEDENAYYVKDADAKGIYTMDKTFVEQLRSYQIFDLLNKYVQLINVTSVQKLTCSYENEEHSITIDHKTQKDKDGKEETVDTFKLDGKDMEDKPARELYQNLIGQKFQAEIPEGYADVDKPVIAKFVFERTKDCSQPEMTIEYKEYDDSFDTVTINGKENFLVDKREVESAVSAMKKAVK